MKLCKWHQELNHFIDIKTTFVLEGNIYDLNPYPSESENGIRWDMVMLDNYLYKYLKSKGYETIVFYNHVDGFYNDFEPEQLQNFLDISGGGTVASGNTAYSVPISRAADLIRRANQNREHLSAVVLMMASRYVLSADSISECERDFYTKLMLSGLKKTQVKTDTGFSNNVMIFVCDKVNDIPVWFYIDNPLVKTLTITNPDSSTRKMFIDSQIKFFTCDVEYSEDTLKGYKELFVELTDGFKNLELNALKILCKNEGISIENIKDAINLYKYGIKDNPWAEIPHDILDAAEAFIKTRVKGQDHAVCHTLDVIKRAASNLAGLQHSSASKPKGILFFAGPTGTGKTELAKTVAELLFGDENACIRFDMSEYQQSHSDQKLLGAPPGYVGYEAGGQLTNAVKERPFSILLFDEIEKAHPSIFDKFLQILEDGRMTDGKGETVYFSECIIIFTSNLGIYNVDQFGNRTLSVTPDISFDELSKRLIKAIQDYFKLQLGRPEILNRIGENFVVFDFIRENVANEILSSQLEKIKNNMKETKQIELEISDNVKRFLFEKSFNNIENGGRGIGNIVEKYFINPLARYIFDNDIQENKIIDVKDVIIENSIVKLNCELL